jgi:protein-disulfide isomerase
LLVEITAQNNDTSASTLPPFHLIDSAGRIYDQSSSGILVNGIISPLESLNPSVSKHGYLLFDVPANRLYTLQVGGGYESEQSALAALFAPPSPTSGAPSPAPNSNDAKPVHKPIVEGLAESPVHAVIYEDLQFPDCAAFHRMMEEKLLPRYGAKVAFVHRDFPLGSHTWARRAAIEARFFIDRKPELGLEYRSYMMAGQQATNADNFNERLASFAKAHDIEPEAAIAALSNARYGETVEQDFQEGVSRGVVHTPTVFVNGKPFVGTFTFEEISKGIDEAIAQAR